jgi:hypothetical protein
VCFDLFSLMTNDDDRSLHSCLRQPAAHVIDQGTFPYLKERFGLAAGDPAEP